MTIPFLDLKKINDPYSEAFKAAYERVLASGWFILGKEVDLFEKEFAHFCGVKHCIGVGNGLDALFLVLKAWGIGDGDEVIVPSNTYIATWLAVSHAGALPVPVEPDPNTFNINVSLVKSVITKKTRAIIPVHLYGQPVDIDPLTAVAKEYNLKILEDAAQAHGACYKGSFTGSLAHAAGFSFYPGKNLGALGDGGAITTNDDDLAQKLRQLRNYGSRKKYQNDVIGFNTRLDEMQAAFLRAKLPFLQSSNLRRQEIAAIYDLNLSSCDLILPKVPLWADPVWHLYVVRSKQREKLKLRLEKLGVETLIHYPIPPHLQKAYSQFNQHSFPIAKELADEVLSLPMGPHLTDDQVMTVIEAINQI